MNKLRLFGGICACLFTFGLVTTANSGQITQLVIQDVGSTLGGVYDTALDGNSGGFSFQPINPQTYIGVTGFSTDTGTPMLWGTVAAPVFQGPSVFATGFLFAGLPVEPFTFGTVNNGALGAPFSANGAIGNITNNTLTIDSLGWAILLNGSTEYIQEPDTGTLQVNWVVPTSNQNEYLVSFQWAHLVTADEDPTGFFTGFSGGWILEGIATVEPENQAPDCSSAVASINTIWPPNHMFMSVSVLSVTDPDDDAVTITIDSIFQDEPVDALGDGRFAPDGSGIGTPTASVRAERSGNQNGRVYHIAFTADDGNGAECSSEVLVGVPHNQNSAPIDGGALYDSTLP
jgi:hypothetical protein